MCVCGVRLQCDEHAHLPGARECARVRKGVRIANVYVMRVYVCMCVCAPVCAWHRHRREYLEIVSYRMLFALARVSGCLPVCLPACQPGRLIAHPCMHVHTVCVRCVREHARLRLRSLPDTVRPRRFGKLRARSFMRTAAEHGSVSAPRTQRTHLYGHSHTHRTPHTGPSGPIFLRVQMHEVHTHSLLPKHRLCECMCNRYVQSVLISVAAPVLRRLLRHATVRRCNVRETCARMAHIHL